MPDIKIETAIFKLHQGVKGSGGGGGINYYKISLQIN